MIAFNDSGDGMPRDIVLRRYDQAPGRGTDPGPSQVDGFIKQSRGHGRIYSGVGGGTTVKLDLPPPDRGPQGGRVLADTTDAGARGCEIILVVDDTLLRRLTTASLRDRQRRRGGCAGHLEPHARRPAAVHRHGNGARGRGAARTPRIKVLFTTRYTPNAVQNGGVLDAGVNVLPSIHHRTACE